MILGTSRFLIGVVTVFESFPTNHHNAINFHIEVRLKKTRAIVKRFVLLWERKWKEGKGVEEKKCKYDMSLYLAELYASRYCKEMYECFCAVRMECCIAP